MGTNTVTKKGNSYVIYNHNQGTFACVPWGTFLKELNLHFDPEYACREIQKVKKGKNFSCSLI